MKKFICLLSAVLFAALSLQAQDLITKKNGEDIKAKILEVGQTEVKYKRFDNPDGPVFTISISDILIIRYENGTNDVFNTTSSVTNYGGYGTREVPAGVVPGMKYKDYKRYYKASDYVRQPSDRWYPAVGGLCSWVIPGLGQMLCGEVGRGIGFLGGAIGASVLMGVGSGLAYDAPGLGFTLTLAGAAALLAIDISAIVDGVKVAKIKNMYEQDMRANTAYNVTMSPYVSTLALASGSYQPVAGMSLRVSF